MTKVPLAELPGGPQLIERLADQVRNLSLLFVSAPDEKVTAVLDEMREDLKVDLAGVIGADAAGEITDAFVAAVRGRRAEIGSGGARGHA